MAEPVIVRDGRPGEARRFEEIRIAGWHAAYTGLLHPEVLRACVVDEERVAWRERWLADPPDGEVTLVAEVDGRVTAGAFLWPSRDADLDDAVAELASLYVEPDLRRSGLGSALLEEGFGRMPQLLEVLWTLEGNTPARRFYEKHGFLADGARRVLRMPGEPIEVRYRRRSPRLA